MTYFPRSLVAAASSKLLTIMQPPQIPGFTGGAAPGLSLCMIRAVARRRYETRPNSSKFSEKILKSGPSTGRYLWASMVKPYP
jgi:hypothetical protein